MSSISTAEKDHGAVEELPVLDKEAERKLLRKIDMFLIPMLGVLYFACFLDRGNIGNAKVAGMADDLGLIGNQYGAAVSVVYSTYVVFEPVYAVLLKLVTPKIIMSVSTFIFGLLTICTAFAGSYGPLMAIRVLLGWAEAGIFPCIVTYFTMTYKREELGKRLSYIFSCAAISGAFGGILAFALTHIRTSSLEGWQWLYIVEGLFTVILAPIAFFYIPNRIDEAFFLNPAERRLCTTRYEGNKMHYDPDEKFSMGWVAEAAKDWRTWVHGVIQFGADVTLYAISTFMPVLINAMGFTSYEAQLLTVPVYFVGMVSFLVQARLSDRYFIRGPFIIANFLVQIIGYIILACSTTVGVRYFGVYVVAAGLYAPTALNVGWTQNNMTPHYKRAAAVGLMQFVGNSAGAAIGEIFSAKLAPLYRRGFYVSIGLVAFAMILSIIMHLYVRQQNAQKRRLVAEGAKDDQSLGDRNPHFMFVL